MSKEYAFTFDGTKEQFIASLSEYENRRYDKFPSDEYIIKLDKDELRFGIQRGSHFGGYWFIPEVTEADGKTHFKGKIRYVDQYENQSKLRNVLDKIGEVLLVILFSPIIASIWLFYFFRVKILKTKPLPTNEDCLFELMEDRLGCRRI